MANAQICRYGSGLWLINIAALASFGHFSMLLQSQAGQRDWLNCSMSCKHVAFLWSTLVNGVSCYVSPCIAAALVTELAEGTVLTSVFGLQPQDTRSKLADNDEQGRAKETHTQLDQPTKEGNKRDGPPYKHGPPIQNSMAAVEKDNAERWQEDSAHNMPHGCQAAHRAAFQHFCRRPRYTAPLILKPRLQESSCSGSFTFSGLRLHRLVPLTSGQG
jgi:hypothetical protein